jgi:hypothetical protein
MKKFSLAFFMIFYAQLGLAQHQDLHEAGEIYKGKKVFSIDTTSILAAFKRGHVNGHFRYFFMATDNASGLSDAFANAAGGGLRYETAKLYGFQFAVSGFYLFNIGSSDLAVKDSITQQGNRYELGLFDIENPYNRGDIDRLEELYLKYNYRKSHLIFGRQLINTPFINLQDGRMRPTGVEGLWMVLNESKFFKLEGGWLYAISPRSTTKWYYVNHSVGIYPGGVNINGSKSDYGENISSKGVGLIGLTLQPYKWLNLKIWDTYFENVLNTALIQGDVKFETSEFTHVYSGLQFIRQDALNDGGNIDQEKTYVNKGKHAMVFGGKVGIKNRVIDLSANYTHITKNGRYLMPREWGRDPFFTFMPRERNEGYGNVHAFVGKLSYNLEKIKALPVLL